MINNLRRFQKRNENLIEHIQFIRQIYLNWFQEVWFIMTSTLLAGANVLRKSPVISDLTKRDVFQLHFSQNDKKVIQVLL